MTRLRKAIVATHVAVPSLMALACWQVLHGHSPWLTIGVLIVVVLVGVVLCDRHFASRETARRPLEVETIHVGREVFIDSKGRTWTVISTRYNAFPETLDLTLTPRRS